MLYSKARPDRRQPAKTYYTCKLLTQRYGQKACQSIPAEASMPPWGFED